MSIRRRIRRARRLWTVAAIFAGLALLPARDARAQDEVRAQDEPAAFALAVHGGAGTIRRESMTPEREQAYRAKLEEALRAGHAVLAGGGTSLDAVIATIQILEASPLFNAGVGAVLTNTGTAELDASIMEGEMLRAGAVAGIQRVKSPIALARRVMEASPHVMLIGEGAEAFAREQGLEMVENEYFRTEPRIRQLEEIKAREQTGQHLDRPAVDPASGYADPLDQKHGTVGAVALDRHGNLAAGTSTGGMMNKRWGRVGDAPIIGAGTYADNETCAVSATGHGEYFIRAAIAHSVAAMMRYAGLSLAEAANAVIHGKLTEMGGTGGLIAMDRTGRVAMPFNTPGMYRGTIDDDGRVVVEIYRD